MTNPVATLAALLQQVSEAFKDEALALEAAAWLLARGVQYAPREHRAGCAADVWVEDHYEPSGEACDCEAAPPREPPPGDELFKRVRRALWTYCQHKSFCRYVEPEYDDENLVLVSEGTPCDCGLHAEMEASQGARGRPEGPSAPDPFAILGRDLAAACEANDVRPGETVEFKCVPHIWEALQRARELLRRTPDSQEPK